MNKYIKKDRLVNVQIVIACVLAVTIVVMVTAIFQRAKYKAQIEEISANYEEQLNVLRMEHESEISQLKQYYEYGGDVTQIEKEAECMAKVFYGMDRNHEDSHLRAIAWCIFNRVEHFAHPDTVIGVCEQPKQWIGYSPDNPVLIEHYELALAELKIWYSGGHRPMNNSYIYLTWSSKEILLRDTFEENRNTNYWRMR